MKKFLAILLFVCSTAIAGVRLGDSDITVEDGTIGTVGASDDITLDPGGDLILNGLTATTVPYVDGSKVLTSSAVTPTELGYLSGVTSNIQTQLDNVSLGGFTINRAIVSDGSGDLAVATTTATEIGYVNGVTSAIQTQLDAKAAAAGWTASRAMETDGSGNLQVSSVTATELGYLSGVTSAIQTQIDAITGSGDAWSDPVDSDIIPDTDSTYDVGSDAVRFAWGYFDGIDGGTVRLEEILSNILGVASPGVSPNGATSGQHLTLQTRSVSTSNTSDSGILYLLTGNRTNGTTSAAESGDIVIQTGSSNQTSGDIAMTVGTGTTTQGNFKFLKSGVASVVGDVWTATGTDGTGYWATHAFTDGPGSSTDNAVARWDGTGGDTLQNSPLVVSDTGEMTLTNTASTGLVNVLSFNQPTDVGPQIQWNAVTSGAGNGQGLHFVSGSTDVARIQDNGTIYGTNLGTLAGLNITSAYRIVRGSSTGSGFTFGSSDYGIRAGAAGATTSFSDSMFMVENNLAANTILKVKGIASQSGNMLTLTNNSNTLLSYFDSSANMYLNAQNDIRFADSDSSNYAAVQAPATIGTNYTLTLPDTDGDADQYLKTDGSGVLSWGDPSTTGRVRAKAYLSGNQSIGSSGHIKVAFDAELYDSDSAFDSTTNYRFTVPTGKGGGYAVDFKLQADSIGVGSLLDIHVYKNGSDFLRQYVYTVVATDQMVLLSDTLNLNAGDYLEFYVNSNDTSYTVATGSGLVTTSVAITQVW